MKYMLLVYLDEQAVSETERQACYAESARLARERTSTRPSRSPLASRSRAWGRSR